MSESFFSYITNNELRDLMEKVFSDPDRKILLLDVRPRRDYEKSHICLSSFFYRRRPGQTDQEKNRIRLMNIDVIQIKPATISKIRTLLDDKDWKTFERRNEATNVIIISPKESGQSISIEAKFMLDALTKWDTSDKKIHCKPFVLRGGFIDWHSSYPQYSTEPLSESLPSSPLPSSPLPSSLLPSSPLPSSLLPSSPLPSSPLPSSLLPSSPLPSSPLPSSPLLSSPLSISGVTETPKLPSQTAVQRPVFNRENKPLTGAFGRAKDTEQLTPLLEQLSFEPLSPSNGQSMTGLKNLGNTCFMNSVIQCLAYAPALSSYFGRHMNHLCHLNFTNEHGSRGELAVQFGALIEKLNNYQYRFLTPKSFRESVVKHIGFAGCDQQDSHEFMMMLFDKLHHDLNVNFSREKQNDTNNNKHNDIQQKEEETQNTAEMGLKFWRRHVELNRSIISETFEGIFMSTLTCLACDNKSNTFELFNCLSLPIPSDTRCSLQNCLAHFSKPERIEGTAWECSRCKIKRDAMKKIVICKLPKMLIIHLKRFSHDGPYRQKLQTDVDFPLENLNVEYILALPPSAYSLSLPSSSDHVNSINGSIATAVAQYNLYAVVNHYGTMDGGHYTAFCHVQDKQNWYQFDDNEVSQISKNDVCTKSAYILFYTSQNFSNPISKTGSSVER